MSSTWTRLEWKNGAEKGKDLSKVLFSLANYSGDCVDCFFFTFISLCRRCCVPSPPNTALSLMLPRGFWVDPDRIVRIVCIDRIDRIDEWEPLNASKQTRSPPLHQCHLNPLHCGCAMESFCAPRNPSAAELGPLLWALPGPAQWIQDAGPKIPWLFSYSQSCSLSPTRHYYQTRH